MFENRCVAMLTKHGKEKIIKPIMENATGCTLVAVNQFDTDVLGTFTREIKREKTQLETARQKIQIGMSMLKTDVGMASEGSFGQHPLMLIPWNVEIVLLQDKKTNLEIFGIYQGAETNLRHLITNSYAEVLDFVKIIGFPEHYVIMRPDNENSKFVIKDINSFEKLKMFFEITVLNSESGNVFIETDMRAHANPTRMKNIEKATLNLITKLHSFCPQCGSPGYIVTDVILGLPCENCGMETRLTIKNILRCHMCCHASEQLYPEGLAAPAKYCDYCNP